MPRASTQDIADLVGVSKMTVSRVLRGERGSRHEKQILEVAQRLDYIPIRPALQNRRTRTNIIGILEEGHFLFNREIGLQTFEGVSQAAFASGYDMLILRPQHGSPLEQRKIQFLDRRCDGFIFIVSHENAEIFEILARNEVPAVCCYTDDVPDGVSWVTPDNEGAVRDAVALLARQGHRHIAFWNGPQGHSDARERTRAFTHAMQEADLPLYRQSYLWDVGPEKDYLPNDLPDMPDSTPLVAGLYSSITAVVCHNDERGLKLWDALDEAGLKVPQDISIIGIDDTRESQERGLTTFRISFSEIGRVAAEAVNALINGGFAADNCHRVPAVLIDRNSTAPPTKQTLLDG